MGSLEYSGVFGLPGMQRNTGQQKCSGLFGLTRMHAAAMVYIWVNWTAAVYLG